MAEANVISERDTEVFCKQMRNKACDEVICFEWQWLPERLSVRVRIENGTWIVLDNQGYVCYDKSQAYHVACWFVRDMSSEKLVRLAG